MPPLAGMERMARVSSGLPWNNAFAFALTHFVLACLALLPPFVGTIVEKGDGLGSVLGQG
jgi:hypothetical protein